jgi:hypothetical protein
LKPETAALRAQGCIYFRRCAAAASLKHSAAKCRRDDRRHFRRCAR